MQKAKRGFGSGRFVWVAMVGSLAFALAGCGGSDSGSAGIGAASGTSTTGSSTPPTVADGAPTTTTSGSSPTTTTAPPSSPAASSSSVTLGWVAPTQNSNGTPITNLAGYKIHYGTTSQDYTQVVALNNPSLSRYVVDSLPSGTYFFAITAYNSQGVESALSGEITTTLN
jgi:hypothetical protein